MYGDCKILGLIPARGGSKGIKNKNIVDLCGKPLIAYTIDAACNSSYIDNIVVTTDSENIAEISKKWGGEVPFLRPKELAEDTSTTLEAVLHAIRILENKGQLFDVLVLLQPTSPLRTTEDIDNAIRIFFEKGRQAVVGVSEVDDHPILVRTLGKKGKLEKLLSLNSTCRRQDMPKYYRVNGSLYVNSIANLNLDTSFNDNEIPYVMEKDHSIDIDEIQDLYMVEYYLKNKI